jgi:aspartyl protease family protein
MLKHAVAFAALCFSVALFAPALLKLDVPPPATRESAVATSSPPAPVIAPETGGNREAILRPNAQGQYFTEVLIEGQAVPMIVDTGASFVSLSWNTAMRLGVRPDPSGRRYRMSTANGEVIASGATLRAISFQGLYMNDVEAIISPPEISTPDLLGTSFIRRLTSVEQRDGLLILRQ